MHYLYYLKKKSSQRFSFVKNIVFKIFWKISKRIPVEKFGGGIPAANTTCNNAKISRRTPTGWRNPEKFLEDIPVKISNVISGVIRWQKNVCERLPRQIPKETHEKFCKDIAGWISEKKKHWKNFWENPCRNEKPSIIKRISKGSFWKCLDESPEFLTKPQGGKGIFEKKK